MSEIKLKKCPFCGGENIRMYAFGISPDCGIVCDDCGGCLEKEVAWKQGMTQKEHDEECKKVLVEAWNTRKPMQEIVEKLEEDYADARNSVYIEEDYYLGMCQGLQYAICHVKEVGGMND